MAFKTLDINGKWQFKQYPQNARSMADLQTPDWLETTVPGSIYTDLVNANQIDPAELTANPENFTQISDKPWIYKKTFDVPNEMLNADRLDLVFDGLDTIATIWLNEKLIARTKNMFIPHRLDVTSLLKETDNTLIVKFDPPVEHAKNLESRYKPLPGPDSLNPYRAYIRKSQYQFGWDFCPALPGCGIWRPVKIEAIKTARIADLKIRTVHCSEKSADIKIALTTDSTKNTPLSCQLTITNNSQNIQQKITLDPKTHTQSTLINIENPKLWFPAGYGQPNLYNLEIELFDGQQKIDHLQTRFGIRTAELITNDENGKHKFQFVINGQPVYARGANWSPASMSPGTLTSADYEALIKAAAEANINMLRVWGGGYYESQDFYNLCDKYGIMVWQDFMFACAYYPEHKDFLDDIKAEASTVIKRLRNHPSLVLFCGNNEIEWMHLEQRLGKSKKFYGRQIFHKILPNLANELAPAIAYIPSTPLIVKRQNRIEYVTLHNWAVWSGHQPVENYKYPKEKIPPFATEFGFQAIPDIKTAKTFRISTIAKVSDRAIEKHNYQMDGPSRLYRYTADNFGPVEDLRKFIYASQVTQARAIKTAVEHLRTNNSQNAGSLFWQFADCAPAISWAAVDSNKIPKALYYYTRRFFAPVLITVSSAANENNNTYSNALCVNVINDSARPVTATLNCNRLDLAGTPLDSFSIPVMLSPFSKSVAVLLPQTMLSEHSPYNSFLHLTLAANDTDIAENFHFFAPDKHIDWPTPQLKTNLRRLNSASFVLELTSQNVVRDLCISTESPAKLSDNFFTMIPQKTCSIRIDHSKDIKPVIELTTVNSLLTA